MARLYVCSLARLAETAEAVGARSLMTLLSPAGVVAKRPGTVGADRHLIVGVSDIVAPREGLTFFRDWDQREPMLIHCYAGVSRSTAAAFIGVCTLAPTRSEREIAAALRQVSPTATPNARLVALADAALGREGRMNEAIQAIGRGSDCFEGEPFGLDLAPASEPDA